MGEISDGQPMFPGDSEVDQLYIIQKVIIAQLHHFLTATHCLYLNRLLGH